MAGQDWREELRKLCPSSASSKQTELVHRASSDKLGEEVRAILKFLNRNPGFRSLIAAQRDQSVFYSGSQLNPCWRDLDRMTKADKQQHNFQTLESRLREIQVPVDLSTAHATFSALPGESLYAFVAALSDKVPKDPDRAVLWRALSGIYAMNARGKIHFHLGSDIRPRSKGGFNATDKIFAVTEMFVLQRNPSIDDVSRDFLDYAMQAIRSGRGGGISYL